MKFIFILTSVFFIGQSNAQSKELTMFIEKRLGLHLNFIPFPGYKDSC